MSDRNQDPSGNTAQFQAFVHRVDPEPTRRSPLPWILGVAAALVVLGAVVGFLVMS